MACSFGNIPTTLVRRLISPLSRSIGLVECSFAQWVGGEVHVSQDVVLRLVVHEGGEFRQAGLHLVDHLAPLDLPAVLSSCAKMVPMNAAAKPAAVAPGMSQAGCA